MISSDMSAILDTATERWQVIRCQETGFVERNPFYHHTTLWRGNVFTSEGGKVRKYEAARKSWVELQLPDVGNCALFTVNNRLYAATRDMIVEILEGGATMRILASNRRQPPVTALDSEVLSASGLFPGTPALFGGSAGTLRLATPKKIYSWNGTEWREVCPAPPAPRPPLISDEGVLFFGDGWNTAAGIWRMPTGSDQLDYCLGQERQVDRQTVNFRPSPQAKPRWKLPQGLTLSRLAAASSGADLFLMADHAKTENIVNEREHVITGTKILTQDGYHAEVFCFSSNYPSPQKLYLKFEGADAKRPVSGGQGRGGFMPGTAPGEWLCFGGGRLYFGREISGPVPTGGRMGDLVRIGVWVTSLEQMDREIERQKKVQNEVQAKVAATARQAARRLLDKCDLDRNSKIEREEMESAFADADFVASQLDQIDVNQNGWMETSELKFFDANTNNVLDASEQTGVEHAQHLLAARLVNRFDSDRNGLLDRREFDGLLRSSFDPETRPMTGMFPDNNHDNWIDVVEVQEFFDQQTRGELQNRPMFGRPVGARVLGGIPATDPRQRFKALVDDFWQNGGTNSLWQPRRPGLIPPTVPKPAQPE